KRGTHIANDHILALRASELMLLVPFDQRRPRPLGWKRRKRRSSQPKLLRDLGSADRRAHLCEEAMSLPKLSLACRFVARKPGKLGAFDVEKGLVAPRARVLNEERDPPKKRIDLRLPRDPVRRVPDTR